MLLYILQSLDAPPMGLAEGRPIVAGPRVDVGAKGASVPSSSSLLTGLSSPVDCGSLSEPTLPTCPASSLVGGGGKVSSPRVGEEDGSLPEGTSGGFPVVEDEGGSSD